MIDDVTTAKGCRLLFVEKKTFLASNDIEIEDMMIEDDNNGEENSPRVSDRYRRVFLYERLTFMEIAQKGLSARVVVSWRKCW